ncbi:hypothetical protein JCM5296_006786 [Sporobolomyces johnsonii]
MVETYVSPVLPEHAMAFTLEDHPAPPTAAPSRPPARSNVDSKGKRKEMNLDRWKDDEEDEDGGDWGGGVGLTGADNGNAVKVEQEERRKSKAGERAKRVVTSESWDDDFLFQHEPSSSSSLAIPRSTASRALSRSQSSQPPTPSPSPRKASSSSGYSSSLRPSTPSSSRSRFSPPASPRSPLPNGLSSNPSLDSLASSMNWSSSDQDPTLTLPLASDATTPKQPSRSSSAPFRTHRPTASSSTARPSSSSSSQHPTPKAKPRLPHRAPPVPLLPSSRLSSGITDDGFRSGTPSLTEDSLLSLTTGEELSTEIETETEDERTNVVVVSGGLQSGRHSPRDQREQEMMPPPQATSLKPSGSKRWRFGRSGKNDGGGGIFGRRTGPREPEEVMVVDRAELDQSGGGPGAQNGGFDVSRSGLPLPKRGGQFVILGRRSRASSGTAKHSSTTSSISTTSTGSSNSRPHRASLQFLPMSFDHPPPVPPRSPTFPPSSQSWREYDGTTSPEEADETTEADVSEFSGDDDGPVLPRKIGGSHRRSVVTPPSASNSASGSTFKGQQHRRPVSPVESILGDRVGRWNTSQVSFASSASAFGLHQSSTPTTGGYESPGAEGTMKGRKRKLVKKRPGAGDDREMLSPSALGLSTDGTSERPLLSSRSSESGTSSGPSSSRTLQRQHRQAPSLPFAQDSDIENGRRRPNRQRSATAPQHQLQNERGEVIELDPDWLGVIPFPPSPRASLDAPHPPFPSTPSSSSLRSPARIFRKVSGTGTKSHPPVTGRTQAEAKSAKRGSGLGQSISNMLSRSTSALPLGGKRVPSPAPSTKSGKSSKSLLVRSGSRKGKSGDENSIGSKKGEGSGSSSKLPKSPSLSALKKRASAAISPAPPAPPTPSRPSISPSVSMPAINASAHRHTSSVDTARPSKESSFFSRARGLSRSTSKQSPPLPPSPVKPSAPPPSASSKPQLSRSSTSRIRPASASATPKGQLNTSFKMPRPHSTVSSISSWASGSTDASASTYASTLKPLGGFRDAAASKGERGPAAGSNGPRPEGSPPQYRSAQNGHRPSLSLSSIMPMRSSSPRPPPPPPPRHEPEEGPYPRPRTALGTDRPPTNYYFDDDLVGECELLLPRRNSLSDLRIPARITNAQKTIEEDLERVKQFAKGIEDLKALRRQYDQLVQIFVEPPGPKFASPLSSPDQPSHQALSKTAQAIRRVELDYSAWWEQAQTLIDLGDGKPPKEGPKDSPGRLASRRDRCVSLAPESNPSKGKNGAVTVPSGSETETEESYAANGGKRPGGLLGSLMGGGGAGSKMMLSRRPSASSIETEASVEARQREMLRGVLAPTIKGSSLPSRGPPSPRPGLSVLTKIDSRPSQPPPSSPSKRIPPLGLSSTVSSPTTPRQKPNNSRRVSRVGVSGIREFLLRLRSKATEELAASVGTLPPSLDPDHPSSSLTGRPMPSSGLRTPLVVGSAATRRRPSSSSESDEDWDAELSPPRNSLVDVDVDMDVDETPRRSRTKSVGGDGGGGRGGGRRRSGEMMVLTTENMPLLLGKVREVQERCEACIGLLRGLTV